LKSNANYKNWLTTRQAATDLDTTSAEICRLISISRLTGVKIKQPGRAGKGQWLVDPRSVTKERHFVSKTGPKPKRAQAAASPQ
jgi:hypothetical protein